MAGLVLSVLNMKGGVGKTTVSAHVMRVLYNRKLLRVLLVDLDAQFNLTQSVRTQEQHDDILENGHTVMSCFEPLPSNDFFQVKKSDAPPPQASEICQSLRSVKKSGGVILAKLDLIPGNFDLMKYSMIDDNSQLSYAHKYFERFVSQAKKEYDLIVFDCNPSSSFITKCALENSTHVLSPVKLDRFSILGVGMVDQLFSHLGIEPKHMILVNQVPRYGRISKIELDLRGHPKYGPRVLKNRVVTTKYLSADPNYTGFATDRGGPYSDTVKRELNKLVDEISLGLGFEA
ncbi:ParA family protein [Thalassospiraceae bacterium SW-3-3]|nr:ParA family protein [Thalassospiraceae bacterium SW-3-3]